MKIVLLITQSAHNFRYYKSHKAYFVVLTYDFDMKNLFLMRILHFYDFLFYILYSKSKVQKSSFFVLKRLHLYFIHFTICGVEGYKISNLDPDRNTVL